jgi:hypothetical protein
MAWQLEFVRLIAFPASLTGCFEQEWWKELAGKPPDDFVSTRRKEAREDKGTFQGAMLSLNVAIPHLIWEARPPAVVDESGNFPTFEEQYRERLDWFAKLLNRWLKASCPALLRLAFSAKLLRPAANATEAYRALADQLPKVDLEPNPNDFLLQINRRKPSSEVVPGLGINRVCSWSKMNIAILVEPGTPFTWPDRCYSALELDINTAPERAAVLPRNSLPSLFDELKSLGLDIAEHGDPA